jgi:hypothetical protein
MCLHLCLSSLPIVVLLIVSYRARIIATPGGKAEIDDVNAANVAIGIVVQIPYCLLPPKPSNPNNAPYQLERWDFVTSTERNWFMEQRQDLCRSVDGTLTST